MTVDVGGDNLMEGPTHGILEFVSIPSNRYYCDTPTEL